MQLFKRLKEVVKVLFVYDEEARVDLFEAFPAIKKFYRIAATSSTSALLAISPSASSSSWVFSDPKTIPAMSHSSWPGGYGG